MKVKLKREQAERMMAIMQSLADVLDRLADQIRPPLSPVDFGMLNMPSLPDADTCQQAAAPADEASGSLRGSDCVPGAGYFVHLDMVDEQIPPSPPLAGETVAIAEGIKTALSVATASPKRPSVATSPMSPARDAIILREWPLGTDTLAIERMLNDLPGVPFPHKRIAVQAAALGVKRPAGFRPARSVKAPAPEPVAASSSPLPAQPPASNPAPAPDFPADEASGKCRVTYAQLLAWCQSRGIAFDGTQVDAINVRRAKAGHAPFVIVG